MAESIAVMEKKMITITGKRQITIPQKYFEALGFEKEAECILRNNEIVIRPARRGDGAFAEQILEELVAQGLSGEALLTAFRERQRKVRPAVERMIDEAGAAARGEGEYASYDSVFAEE